MLNINRCHTYTSNLLQANVLFLFPPKIPENHRFLMFLGRMKMEQCNNGAILEGTVEIYSLQIYSLFMTRAIYSRDAINGTGCTGGP